MAFWGKEGDERNRRKVGVLVMAIGTRLLVYLELGKIESVQLDVDGRAKASCACSVGGHVEVGISVSIGNIGFQLNNRKVNNQRFHAETYYTQMSQKAVKYPSLGGWWTPTLPSCP